MKLGRVEEAKRKRHEVGALERLALIGGEPPGAARGTTGLSTLPLIV